MKTLEQKRKDVGYIQVTICSLIIMSGITIFRNYNPEYKVFDYMPQIILGSIDTFITILAIWALTEISILKHNKEWSGGAKVIFYSFFILISLAVMIARFMYYNGDLERTNLLAVTNAESIVLGVTFIASVINPRYGIANVVAVATVMYIFIDPNHSKYIDAIIFFGIAMILGGLVKFIFFTDWRKYVREKEQDQNAH